MPTSSGALPPVTERMPENPYVMEMDGDRQTGKYGGALNVLMARSKDVRQMVVYGYARLVKYSRDFELVPDILEAANVEEGRIFTLRLRKGHGKKKLKVTAVAPYLSRGFEKLGATSIRPSSLGELGLPTS